MQWDFVAYGGGPIYRDVFNAVALMSGQNAIDSLLRLAMVLGLCIALVKAITDFNIGNLMRWFLFAYVIYGVLWVPKVTINVTDRLNPAGVYAVVPNVPLGVGASAALVSQIGDKLIQMTQTAFGDPADASYSSHGMIFAAKMFSKIADLRPVNQLVALNVTSYMQNCGFYDIQDNTVPIDALQNSSNMWNTLVANPNPARLGPYTKTDGTVELKACTDFAGQVTADMAADRSTVQKYLYSSLSSDTPEAQMNTQENNVSVMVTTAIGATQDADTVISQAVTRNMLNDSLKGYMGSSNGVLAATMADLQTQNTQKLFGVVAEKAVVNLKIVIELLFIGIFPAIFPLFLLPKLGPQMAKGYLAGFFYLQLWGPMYVILHKIMMWNAINASMQATFMTGGTHALTAMNLQALAAANQDVCSLAGSMMLMIPVLAGLLTKGAMAVGAQGEALLGNFRSGAEAASASMTSGNWSFGNAAVGNLSYDNVNANHHVTSAFTDEGNSTVVENGMTTTTYANGSQRFKADLTSGAPGLNMATTYSETMSRMSQQYKDESHAISEADTYGRQFATTAMDEAFRGNQSGTGTLSSLSTDSQKSVSDFQSQLASFSQDYGMTTSKDRSNLQQQVTSGTASLSADGSLGLQEFGTGAKVGAGGSLSKTGSTTGTEGHSDNDKASRLAQLQDTYNKTFNAVRSEQARAQYDRTTSNFTGKRHVDSNTFSTSKSAQETSSYLQSVGDRASQESSHSMNNVNEMNAALLTPYIDSLRGTGHAGQIKDILSMTPAGMEAFQATAPEFLKSLAGNTVSGFEEELKKPFDAGLTAPPEIQHAAADLNAVAADGRLHTGVDAALASDTATPSTAQSRRTSSKSKRRGSSVAHDAQDHDQHGGSHSSGDPHMPQLMQLSGGVSSEVDQHVSGNGTARMMVTGIVHQGQQNTGGDIDTTVSIAGSTGETVHKMNHADGLGGVLRQGLVYTNPSLSGALDSADDLLNGKKAKDDSDPGPGKGPKAKQ